jgi:hypothetical protein
MMVVSTHIFIRKGRAAGPAAAPERHAGVDVCNLSADTYKQERK